MTQVWLIGLACCAVGGLRAEGPPAFEVASVKPSVSHVAMSPMNGGPGTSDPSRINYSNVTMEQILTKAYNVRYDEIVGPGWLPYQRFDVLANVPEGTSEQQFRLMLQTLLQERFHLAAHFVKKDLPSYLLLIGKNGPKLTPSQDDSSAKDGTAPHPEEGPGPAQPLRFTIGKDGRPDPSFDDGGVHTSMRASNGEAHLNAVKMSMTQLAKMLAQELDRPVVDMTGLKGNYDFLLTYPATGPKALERQVFLILGAAPPVRTPDSDTGPGISEALQSQIGLKLEMKKSPVDVLVIDGIEKVPTPD